MGSHKPGQCIELDPTLAPPTCAADHVCGGERRLGGHVGGEMTGPGGFTGANCDCLPAGAVVNDDEFCQNGRFCFMEEFANYMEAKNGVPYTINTALSKEDFLYELAGEGFKKYMWQLAGWYNANNRAYMANGLRQRTGVELDDPVNPTTIKIAWVTFNATYPRYLPKDEANELHERWSDFQAAYDKGTKSFQTTVIYLFMT